jgi:hypothetical protein
MSYRAWTGGLLLSLATAVIAVQFPRPPRLPKDVPVPSSLPGKVPGVDRLFTGESPITTALADAVTELAFLDGYDPKHPLPMVGQQRAANGGFLLSPGLYELNAQSYCLHAGSYAPTQGDGYMYAPLKGPRSNVIRSILRRSPDYPAIPQQGIQSLIWAILARTRVQDLSRDLQAIAAQLLTPREILEIDGGSLDAVADRARREAMANLPEPVRRAFEAEARLRGMFARGNASYAELEQAAVLFGAAPRGEGSRDVPGGRWSYYPDGYFVRYHPAGYSRTRVDVYLPERFTVEQDAQSRITRLVDAVGNATEVQYDDSAAPLRVANDNAVAAYAWKLVRFVHAYPARPKLAQKIEYRNAGWTYVEAPPPASQSAPLARYPEWQQRYAESKQWGQEIQAFGRAWERAGRPWSEPEPVVNLLHFRRGLQALVESQSSRPEWLAAHLDAVYEAFQSAFCRSAGACRPPAARTSLREEYLLAAARPLLPLFARSGSQGEEVSPVTPLPGFDGSGQVAVPANTAKQRLAQSDRPTDAPCTQAADLEEVIGYQEKVRDLYQKYQNAVQSCEELHNKVQDEFNQGCPGCKATEGGHFDPSEAGNPKGECLDACGQGYPHPACDLINAACRAHEQQHADDWKACTRFPSACAQRQENITNFCAEMEQNAYNKGLAALRNSLKNFQKSCNQ